MNYMLFFCDIVGTITGIDDYKTLKEKLEQLRNLYNCDKIIFSLVSSEKRTVVYNYMMKLVESCNRKDKIIFGKQFYDIGYIDFENKEILEGSIYSGKVGQIVKYCKELSKNYNFNLVCYADDNANELIEELLCETNKNSEVKVLVPNNNKKFNSIISTETPEIEGLYECMDILIKQKEDQYTKDKRI